MTAVSEQLGPEGMGGRGGVGWEQQGEAAGLEQTKSGISWSAVELPLSGFF